ncbi:very-long-chain 3-oxoacyl-CoA reductase-like [Babylonia areolata]|uniref:very-long-chain 3-oxoacyl-CoA reductase-like n=1 Tax=Babylonia areolata TaxID=304850 RepID=UPI003FD587EC
MVTGCTEGIGKSYAFQLAEKGMDIVLVSRNPQKLSAVAEKIVKQFQVSVKVIVADFKKTDIYDSIKQQLTGLDIGVLVNNVGMLNRRTPGYFCEADDFDQFNRDIVNVNVLSCVMMTGIVLPDMLKRKRGVIINISSGSGLRPMPFFSIYSATKAFICFFSEALNQEYSSQGVSIQVVTPMLVQSNMSVNISVVAGMTGELMFPTSDHFVQKALRTIGREPTTSAHWPHELQQYFLDLMVSDSSLRQMFLQKRNQLAEHLKAE